MGSNESDRSICEIRGTCAHAAKADGLTKLAWTAKGHRKILHGFSSDFEPALRSSAVRNQDYSKLWEIPCFAFATALGFGAEFQNVRDAYERLSQQDSWLIVLPDASAGI